MTKRSHLTDDPGKIVFRQSNGEDLTWDDDPSSITANFWEGKLDLEASARRLTTELRVRHLIGQSPAFLAVKMKLVPVAHYNVNVLILGETGTGKELFARAIHYLSHRSHQPFVPVNCGAIPMELMETELFGHERGAFTGAHTAKPGLIHEAQRGTLFLDEIDCLPLLAQVKLLRFLQEKEYRPLGSTKAQGADVRVIAATNADLEKAVREEKFRQDLYYRLNVVPLSLPPLRERKEDIPLLAHHFLAKYADEFAKQIKDFSPAAMQRLTLYEWPGNVRELEHVVERAVILAQRELIDETDLFLQACEPHPPPRSFREAKAEAVTRFERAYLQELLSAHRGNITRAAATAQKNRRAFWQLLQKHKIAVFDFKAAQPHSDK